MVYNGQSKNKADHLGVLPFQETSIYIYIHHPLLCFRVMSQKSSPMDHRFEYIGYISFSIDHLFMTNTFKSVVPYFEQQITILSVSNHRFFLVYFCFALTHLFPGVPLVIYLIFQLYPQQSLGLLICSHLLMQVFFCIPTMHNAYRL